MNNLTSLISHIASKRKEKTKVKKIFENTFIDKKNKIISQQTDIVDLPLKAKKSNWEAIDNEDFVSLRRIYDFKNLKNMLYFLNEGIKILYSVRHENQIYIKDDTVIIDLYTPGINDITDIDKQLSKKIDEVYDDIFYIEL
jgi:pterin-4a-carbinolamine dehydratase